ncbi:MAG TPA: ABC transporter ATP-binding protein [Albitalea sp.]
MNEPLQLAVESLSLRAGGTAQGRVLFDDLGFGVHPGQRWVVLGPNGAGKSSLLAAMAGVFPLAGGRVVLQGRPLTLWPAQSLADWRAWCPQFWSDPFPSTVSETARIAMRRGAWWNVDADDETTVVRLLSELDLDTLAHSDVRQLSGGERQRVAIATTLLQGAPLVLLDEPASHLDLAHQQLLLRLLERRSAGGHAVVASLHDINLAWDMATHAVLLDGRGQAVAGPRERVMTPAHLSQAFRVGIDRVEVCGQARFWVGPNPAAVSPP